MQTSVKIDISKSRLDMNDMKVIIKDDVCMMSYNGKEPLNLQTDSSHIGLEVGLQARDGLWFP